MLARDLMTEDPVRLAPDRTLREAEHLMREYDMRHVPVVGDDGTLVGMVSDRDIRSYIPWDGQFGVPDLEAIDRRSDPVTAVMQPDPLAVTPEDEIGAVIDLMVQWKVGALPVVETEKLVGIISYVDVLRGARPRL